MTQNRTNIANYALGIAAAGALTYVAIVTRQEPKPVEAKQEITISDLAQCNAQLVEGIATNEFNPYGAVTGENFKLPAKSASDMTSYYKLHTKLNPQDDSGRITPGNVYRALDFNGNGEIKGLISFDKDRRLNDIAEELTSSGLIKRQNPFQLYSGRCDTSKTYKVGEQ